MKFIPTDIPDVMLVQPTVFEDSRGYFYEFFRENVFNEHGPKTNFVQQSESKSSYGVVRGLHYQMPPHAQTKLVRVVHGKIIDVAVDIRRDSKTFGKHVAIELSAENKSLLLIPRGFAHGFSVQSESAIINYMVDNYYAPDSERGIIYDDPDLSIDWQVDPEDAQLSEKDTQYPRLENAEIFEGGNNLYAV